MEPDQVQHVTPPDINPLVGIGFGVFFLIVTIFYIVCAWKIFTKAEEPGWASLIPIYNSIVGLKIAGKPLWWIVLLFIPGVNFVVGIIVAIAFCEKFGKGAGFAIGMIFLSFIFLPILAFGDAKYIGPKTA